jgi:hypothetical protein
MDAQEAKKWISIEETAQHTWNVYFGEELIDEFPSFSEAVDYRTFRATRFDAFAAAHSAQVEAELRQSRNENQWLRANFCEHHQTVCTCSSGPCGLCEAKKEQAFSAQLESNIKFLNERVGAAEAELVKLREALRWIPVEERLPESEGRYLIVYQQLRTRRAFIGDYIPQESRWTCVMNDMRVTHWREIGELPGEALGETGPEEKAQKSP